MIEISLEVTYRELHGARAAVLEAVTDEIFDVEPDILARADELLADLSSGRQVSGDVASLEVIDRSLRHVAVSIEPWEMAIRVGLTMTELDLLSRRVATARRIHLTQSPQSGDGADRPEGSR
ncbi:MULTISPECIES: hypothetical protein [unclassified Aeromicrobium]|uniref:hypothetical protein n=1 Tax=unclassified Aeromicrobium TaxID=2633570 RepID=UPI002096AAE4|nr:MULTISPECIES: hypothetical protein [unclassified Aeromicrobium]MCO7237744.1 hypothetical protein [Aeromicrobium sp. CnD17-E]MDR6117704.1 hypothetical protein [Aeromicrobium sp. SORGH_AS_0981]